MNPYTLHRFIPEWPKEDFLDTNRVSLNHPMAHFGETASLNSVLATMTPRIGRLVLIEVEYLKAMRQADLEWVKLFLEDLRSGSLVWDPDLLRQHVNGAGKKRL